ncbi:non-histone chromosomal MC1 family protein [Haloplanus salilacus]|uniref:non-histone chromosomal MC1 family protein n=1 Tax=Haloplanus salilacus TaxID=2949994 RepID=UPI0030D0143C
MVREDDKRNFALQDDGEEDSVFSGNMPRQAALKAARRLENPADSEEEAEANPTEIRLREKGTDKVHVYDAWAWNESPPDVDMDEWDAEDEGEVWLSDVDEITNGNVSKKGIEHQD